MSRTQPETKPRVVAPPAAPARTPHTSPAPATRLPPTEAPNPKPEKTA